MQNHAVLRDGVPLLPYPGFDVCAETEFADFDTMRAGFASPHYQQTVRGDEKNLIDGSRFMLALTRRQIVADGQPTDDAVEADHAAPCASGGQPERLIDTLLGGRMWRPPRTRGHSGTSCWSSNPRSMSRGCRRAAMRSTCSGSRRPKRRSRRCGQRSERAGWLLAGIVFGSERLIARPIRQR